MPFGEVQFEQRHVHVLGFGRHRVQVAFAPQHAQGVSRHATPNHEFGQFERHVGPELGRTRVA